MLVNIKDFKEQNDSKILKNRLTVGILSQAPFSKLPPRFNVFFTTMSTLAKRSSKVNSILRNRVVGG